MKKAASYDSENAFMLGPWDECVAEYKDMKMQNGFLHLYLEIDNKTKRLSFSQESREATIVKTTLEACPKGLLIAILRTSLESEPLLIKILRDT